MNATLLPGVLLWGTMPVPYVASWTSEDVLLVAPEPRLKGRPALFRSGRRGEGSPIFGQMDEARTREVVLDRRCQVCRDNLPGYSYVADLTWGRRPDGSVVVREPPACLRCFRVAVHRCPGIQRRLEHPRLLMARVKRYRADLLTATAATGPDASPALNACLANWSGPPPVGYARALLTVFDRITLADLT